MDKFDMASTLTLIPASQPSTAAEATLKISFAFIDLPGETVNKMGFQRYIKIYPFQITHLKTMTSIALGKHMAPINSSGRVMPLV